MKTQDIVWFTEKSVKFCDKHYSEWLAIWNELTQTAGHSMGYADMIGNTRDLTDVTLPSTADSVTVVGKELYLPLQFWFCRNPGLALPLIALTLGLKSILPFTFEHCIRLNSLGSQSFAKSYTQMLVGCVT
jgi:hypothetical protein